MTDEVQVSWQEGAVGRGRWQGPEWETARMPTHIDTGRQKRVKGNTGRHWQSEPGPGLSQKVWEKTNPNQWKAFFSFFFLVLRVLKIDRTCFYFLTIMMGLVVSGHMLCVYNVIYINKDGCCIFISFHCTKMELKILGVSFAIFHWWHPLEPNIFLIYISLIIFVQPTEWFVSVVGNGWA